MDALVFQAGGLASKMGFVDPEIVEVAAIIGMAASSRPLIVISREGLSEESARAIADLRQERQVLVVAGLDPSPLVAESLGACLVVVGQEASDADGSEVKDGLSSGTAVSQELLSETVAAILELAAEIEWDTDLHSALLCSLRTSASLRAVADWDAFHLLWYGGWFSVEFQPTPDDMTEFVNDEGGLQEILYHTPADAMLRWDLVVETVRTIGHRLVEPLCSHPATRPSDIVDLTRAMLDAEDVQNLAYLAGDCRCPAEMLAVLARHPSEVVRRAVLHNPSAPKDTLKQLTNDSSVALAADAVSRFRDHTEGTLAESLLKAVHRMNADGEIEGVVEDGLVTLHRCVIAAHPDLPVDGLRLVAAKLAEQHDAKGGGRGGATAVLCNALCFNPNTPEDALDLLRSRGWFEEAFYRAGRGMKFGPERPPMEAFCGSWDDFISVSDADDSAKAAVAAQSYVLSEAQLVDMARSRSVDLRLSAVCHPGATAEVLATALRGLVSDDLF